MCKDFYDDCAWHAYESHRSSGCKKKVLQPEAPEGGAMGESAMTAGPPVAVIILNWSRWRDTVRCLESVFQSAYGNFCVVLVDNGSQDGSVENVMAWAEGRIPVDSQFFSNRAENKPIPATVLSEKDAAGLHSRTAAGGNGRLHVVLNKKNRGFSRGNNIGIRYALQVLGAQYVMLLNNDTIILPDCMRELVRAAEHEPGAGACQAKMLSMSAADVIDTAGISLRTDDIFAEAIGHGVPDGEDFSRIRDIFGACAGAALYRKSMLDEIGLFDEDYFAYYEDVDLAFRARIRGWRALYVPGAVVYHEHSATLGKEAPVKTRLLERNRYYCMIKNAPRQVLISFLRRRPGVFRRTLRHLLQSKQYRYALAYACGNLEALVRIPKFFFKRLRVRSPGTLKDTELLKWYNPSLQ